MYNPAENSVLVQTDVDGGTYELYMIPKEAGRDMAPVCLLSAAALLPVCGTIGSMLSAV